MKTSLPEWGMGIVLRVNFGTQKTQKTQINTISLNRVNVFYLRKFVFFASFAFKNITLWKNEKIIQIRKKSPSGDLGVYHSTTAFLFPFSVSFWDFPL